MLFKIFKKIAGIIGFKLVEKNLIKNDRELSKNAFYSMEKILHSIFEKNKVKILIQIGSNDGKRFDSLNKFIKEYSPTSILVEPIKEDFIDLQNNYKDYQKIFFENSAISVNNEVNTLYKVDNTKSKLYGEHARGITSFNINHLLKHGISKSHIKKEKVNSISVKELLKKYSLDTLDLLMIDTEGYDGDIIIDFLTSCSLRPIIIFEYIHINHKTFKKLINLLNLKKFFYFKIDENVICFPEEFGDYKKLFS
jgi:FkbM family methyltransferase